MYSFTIYGNHEKRDGDPVPYTRTLRQAWRQDASRYKQWHDYVITAFLAENSSAGITLNMARYGKPITVAKDHIVEMDIVIYWRAKHGGKHGDPDNIFKGIADALFVDDKEVYGTITLGGYNDKNPRVNVKIKIKAYDNKVLGKNKNGK